jgi:hypothetical protein
MYLLHHALCVLLRVVGHFAHILCTDRWNAFAQLCVNGKYRLNNATMLNVCGRHNLCIRIAVFQLLQDAAANLHFCVEQEKKTFILLGSSTSRKKHRATQQHLRRLAQSEHAYNLLLIASCGQFGTSDFDVFTHFIQFQLGQAVITGFVKPGAARWCLRCVRTPSTYLPPAPLFLAMAAEVLHSRSLSLCKRRSARSTGASPSHILRMACECPRVGDDIAHLDNTFVTRGHDGCLLT